MRVCVQVCGRWLILADMLARVLTELSPLCAAPLKKTVFCDFASV